MKYKSILLALLLVMAESCSFLEVTPDKSGNATINTMEQLYQLMGNAGFYNDVNYIWSENLLFTDDVEVSPYLYKKIGNAKLYQVATADRKFLRYDPSMVETTWDGIYSNMFTFNVVLDNLDRVEQSTPAVREQVRGEALFNRAYFHFFGLVNYCAYDMDAPGIGYKDNTLAAPEGLPSRETVAYTVRHIREDLENAEKALIASGRTKFEPDRNFRVSLPALYAFKARFELYLGNYDAALEAAGKALKGHSSLSAFAKDPMYAKAVQKSYDILDKDGKPTGEKIEYKDFSTDLNAMFGGYTFFLEYEELYLPHFTIDKFGNVLHPMSKSLYDLYDKTNDARWKCFYDNNYTVSLGSFSNEGFDFEEQSQLKEWERHTYLRFNVYGNRVLVIGPTTAEMYLIQAECHARKGDAAKAKECLVTLRKSRFTDETVAGKIEGTVGEVLDERRREFAGVLRFYDLKRLNFKENANITFSKKVFQDMYDTESPVVDKLFPADMETYTFPIPESERIMMGW